ncbi:hypothetical protein HYPSUDRAFT_45236 [Hypholoma sublateritium FD-334 SS-4]|uniref:Uncharacterized protein n=1 Tax=Hypholoma sublateritium (strain FD-334 SS-4) TaxID=945553 RepID=A0A0D2NNM6_HYPSF|nr:hypothetical protein HYPSUDRAFT_45236 [Hypholoma sublateritium FD-334 SS-4]
MIDTRAFRHCRSSDWGVEPFVIDPPTSPELFRTWITADRFQTLSPWVKRMYAKRFNVPDENALRIPEIDDLFCRFNKRLPMFPDFMEWAYDAASTDHRKLVGKPVQGGKPAYDGDEYFKSVFSGEPEDPDYSPWLPTRPLATDMPRSPLGHRDPYNGEDMLINLLGNLAMQQSNLHFRLQHHTSITKGLYRKVEHIRTAIEDERRKFRTEAVFGAPPQPPAMEAPPSSGGRRRPKAPQEPFDIEKKYLEMLEAKAALSRAFHKVEGIQSELHGELYKSNEVLATLESMNRSVTKPQVKESRREADIRGPAVLARCTLPTEGPPSPAAPPAQADADSHRTQHALQLGAPLPYNPDVEPHRASKRSREDMETHSANRGAETSSAAARKRRRLPQPHASGSGTIHPPGVPTTPRPLKRTREEADIDAPAAPSVADTRSDDLPPAAKKARSAGSNAKRVLINRDTGACEYVWDTDEAIMVLRRWEVEQERAEVGARKRAEADARKRAEVKARKRAAGPSFKDSIVASAAAFGRKVWGVVS